MRDIVRMVGVLVAVCAVAAFGLARVHRMTEGPIREAKRQELLRAVRAVLPAFDNAPDAEAVAVDEVTYYPGRKGGRLTGVAFPVASPEGYAGTIEALVGVDPDGRVSGVVVLSHAETPGLGAKITDPGFLAQFRGKDLAGAKWAVKKDGGDFDQITGATISPRALVQALRRGLERFERARDRVVAAPPGDGAGAADAGEGP
ncbi:MAG: electron transport complex subunit RsxG [Deferrisomatales bacterium]